MAKPSRGGIMENLQDNQVEKVDLVTEEYILPDDYIDEEVSEETESESVDELKTDELEEVTEGEETEGETEEADNEESTDDNTIESLDDLEIKFLGNSTLLKDMPRDDVQKYIQVGMNQERFHSKFEELKGLDQEIAFTAEMFNMDTKTMLQNLRDNHYKSIADQEGRSVNDVKTEYDSKFKDLKDKPLKEFVKKYPDVKADDLPQQVLMDMRDGIDPTKAYEKYLSESKMSEKDTKISDLEKKIAELEKAVQTKEQNTKSKKKGVVKKTTDSGIDNQDDFLAGLLGDD